MRKTAIVDAALAGLCAAALLAWIGACSRSDSPTESRNRSAVGAPDSVGSGPIVYVKQLLGVEFRAALTDSALNAFMDRYNLLLWQKPPQITFVHGYTFEIDSVNAQPGTTIESLVPMIRANEPAVIFIAPDWLTTGFLDSSGVSTGGR